MVRIKTRKPKPVPTFLCRNRAEVTAALAAVRKSLGISQLELDEIAGFSTGYTGKLERPGVPGFPGKRPTGRSALHPMFDDWVNALGVVVAIVPVSDRLDFAQAVAPPMPEFKMTRKQAAKVRVLFESGRFTLPRLAEKFGCSLGKICEITEA